MGRVSLSPLGRVTPPQKKIHFWSRNEYSDAFFGPSECLLQRCNTSRSRLSVCLPTLTFQADCGSIKGAGVSAEEGTEHYLPGSEYARNLIIAKVETQSHDDTYSHSFSSDGHGFGGPLWIRHCTRCICLLPSFHWHSHCLPTEGWPGWVDLGS